MKQLSAHSCLLHLTCTLRFFSLSFSIVLYILSAVHRHQGFMFRLKPTEYITSVKDSVLRNIDQRLESSVSTGTPKLRQMSGSCFVGRFCSSPASYAQ
jgi:hypothetical protein